MTRWALVNDGAVVNVVESATEPGALPGGSWVPDPAGQAEPGGTYAGGAFTRAAHADPTQWLIDVGPFMDRFGLAKLAVLSSTDATVRALVTDILARRWIDLQRPDVAAGIDLIIAAGVAGVDGALKTAILTTPVTSAENMALRRLYFGG